MSRFARSLFTITALAASFTAVGGATAPTASAMVDLCTPKWVTYDATLTNPNWKIFVTRGNGKKAHWAHDGRDSEATMDVTTESFSSSTATASMSVTVGAELQAAVFAKVKVEATGTLSKSETTGSRKAVTIKTAKNAWTHYGLAVDAQRFYVKSYYLNHDCSRTYKNLYAAFPIKGAEITTMMRTNQSGALYGHRGYSFV